MIWACSESSPVPDDRRVLEGIGRLVVDGSNVLHALSRGVEAAPPAALIGRLRAIVPPGVTVTVVLDGSPGHGLVARHVASGVEVRYAGRETADELIGHMLLTAPPGDNAGTLVVTDDFDLGGTVRRYGGRTARSEFLLRRLDRQRLSSPAPGRPVAPAPPAPPESGGSGRSGEDEGSRWSPGRGATRKKGNPRRQPRSGRT